MVTARQIEKAEFIQRVETTLAEARRASREAADNFVANTHERYFEFAGSAALWIYKPTYRLREALKRFDAIERWLDGQWEIKADEIDDRHKAMKGVTLREVACRAALQVFEREFPAEGRFSIHAWID